MKKTKIRAVLENLDEMIDFIIADLNSCVSDKKLVNLIRLSCEEVLVNIISYAYPDSEGDVEIIQEIPGDNGEIFIRFIDDGFPYNPLLNDEPDMDASIENRKIGGLGVYLYKTIMDSVIYERKEGKNILTFIKEIKKDEEGK
ncbi:MAG: ATP-binding protein [Clostridiaceae bacterium]|nr:ATP-binding protein [Clostridiaceae bacterium]